MSSPGFTPHQRDWIRAQIQQKMPGCRVLAFGSRTRNDYTNASDLDLCLDMGGPVPLAVLGDLKEIFSQSDLPYSVDICDWHRITEDFREHIQTEAQKW
jgi:predicted nucleotidyltransferase